MKSFEEYIREAVYFRLGGKGDKGEDLYKTFRELEEGDKIYLYKFHDFNIKSMSSYVFMFDSLSIKDADYDLIRGRLKTSANAQISSNAQNINILKSNVDKEYFVCFFEYKIRRWKHVSSYVYSTYEMTEEEVLEVTNKAWKMKDKSFKQYIEESVDFRLGGKASKGEFVKSFGELERGDLCYAWRIGKVGQYIHKDVRIVLDVSETPSSKKLKIHYEHEIKNYPQPVDSMFFDIERTNENVILNETDMNFLLYTTYDMTDVEARRKVAKVVASGNYQK